MDIVEKVRFVRKLVLLSIFSDDELMDIFVVKGGSAIDLVYKLDSRASRDIDLSMAKDFTEEELADVSGRLKNAIQQTFAENGYAILDFKMSPRPKKSAPLTMNDYWGGYEVQFKILNGEQADLIQQNVESARRHAEVLGEDNAKIFTIDISKYEHCQEKDSVEIDGYTVYVYTPKMLVVEKLRAICQQLPDYQHNNNRPNPRAKDFYDIAMLISHYGMTLTNADMDLIRCVFEKKRVELSLLQRISQNKDFFLKGLESLRATLTPESLAGFDFDDCFTLVVLLSEQITAYEEQRAAG